MTRRNKFLISSAALAGVAGTAGVVHATQRPPAPRISMEQARATALQAAPGDIVEAEYELENGSWRYSFDIRQGGRIHEVGIDANSGAIVENAYESAEDEADEAGEMDDEDDAGEAS